MNIETQVVQALARGYCTPENARKVLDPDLIVAMTKEITKLFSKQCRHAGEIQVCFRKPA